MQNRYCAYCGFLNPVPNNQTANCFVCEAPLRGEALSSKAYQVTLQDAFFAGSREYDDEREVMRDLRLMLAIAERNDVPLKVTVKGPGMAADARKEK